MYLVLSNHFQVDEIVKSFEVAYRSFVVEVLRNIFKNDTEFLEGIEQVLEKTKQSSLINSKKYADKLKKIKGSYKSNYKVIDDCFNSYQSKTYENNDVPYVSTIVDYIEFFFNPHFANSDILKGFSPNKFIFYSEQYYDLRNKLSHPAASKIYIKDVKGVLFFLKALLPNLEDKYFWYVSKSDIETKIADFEKIVETQEPKEEEIPSLIFSFKSKNFLIMEEDELAITLQDIARIHKQKNQILFDVTIVEEKMIYGQIEELKKDKSSISNKQRISDLKDICLQLDKIKEEIKYKVIAVLIFKFEEGYGYTPFTSFATILFQMLSKLRQVTVICENTIIVDILEVSPKLYQINYRRGSMKLDMKLDIMSHDRSIVFSIYESKQKLKELYESNYKNADFEDKQMPLIFHVLGLCVCDLEVETIISKVLPAYIDMMYSEYPEDILKNIGISNFAIGIG